MPRETRIREIVQSLCEAAVIFSGYLAYALADDLTRPSHPVECSLWKARDSNKGKWIVVTWQATWCLAIPTALRKTKLPYHIRKPLHLSGKNIGSVVYAPSSLPLISRAHPSVTSSLKTPTMPSQQKSFGADHASNNPNQLALTEWGSYNLWDRVNRLMLGIIIASGPPVFVFPLDPFGPGLSKERAVALIGPIGMIDGYTGRNTTF